VRERKKRAGIAASLAVGLLLSTTLVLAPTASAFIYWANGGETGASTIGRANNDGSGANPNFITGQKEPCGVAVDSQHIYWANQVGGSIGRANLDGSDVDPNFITGALLPCGVALDGTRIWWANGETSVSTQTGQVARANLDGSGASVLYSGSTLVEGPRGIGVGSNLVYWSNDLVSPQSIGRGGVDGTPPPVKNFITMPSNLYPAWPTVAGGRLYFTLTLGLTSTDLEGADPSPGIPSTAYGGIAVHGSKLYWANLTEGTLSRANLDFTSPDFAFMTGLGKPTGLAVDGGTASATTPSNEFTFSVKGKRLLVAVNAQGTVDVLDAGTRAASAAGKKRRRLLLRPSSAAGGPPTVTVQLALTKTAKQKLRQKGKVSVKARITFTPTGGVARTQTARLKIKAKTKRK
jgi:hypothetical protein